MRRVGRKTDDSRKKEARKKVDTIRTSDDDSGLLDELILISLLDSTLELEDSVFTLLLDTSELEDS